MTSQLVLPLETQAAHGRADFITAPGNQAAVAFIDSWPAWPAPAAVLHGPPASGKTHLSHAWAAASGAAIICATALDGGIPDGALVVEDVGQGVPEAPLFALLERGAPLLLTSQVAPGAWATQFGLVLPDLVSRSSALLEFPLWAPDDSLLMALAAKLFDDRQLKVPEAVVTRMLARLERSPAAIRDFVARADQRALAEKRPVNPGLIREMLA